MANPAVPVKHADGSTNEPDDATVVTIAHKDPEPVKEIEEALCLQDHGTFPNHQILRDANLIINVS